MFYPYTQQIVRVNGEGGARAYQMQPNSSVLLLDDTAPLIWLKTTDGAGYPSITPFEIKEHRPAPTPDVTDLINRIARLEEQINESNNTDNGTGKQHCKTAKSSCTDVKGTES